MVAFASAGCQAPEDPGSDPTPLEPREGELPEEPDAEEGLPHVCGGSAPPLAEIAWQDGPTDASVESVDAEVVSATIRNVGTVTLYFSEIRAMGNASGIPFTVADLTDAFSLEPGATQPVQIDLGEHADLASMLSSGSVEIFARVDAEDGSLLEHAASETLYFNPSAGGLELYNAEGLRAAKNAGDVADRAANLILPGTRRVVVFAPAADEGGL